MPPPYSLLPTVALPPTDLGNGLERVAFRAEAPVTATASFFFRIVVAGKSTNVRSKRTKDREEVPMAGLEPARPFLVRGF